MLAPPCPGQQMVVTEGLFSMKGDSAPLGEIQQVTHQPNGWLMVDDAPGHGRYRGARGAPAAGCKR
ncbi:aminotransferase class I/II-fold pyridoxal phosphate-dependent enzyme [Actinobacillus pleuropneumoniae]|uniref:aminotransferase class I/II-fold pyridoxal phosphate-dependent enzyme n=1 Tax=Actinobacillus pleuropneumoniae TaxID=715 RepID=UPI003BF58A43